MSKEPITLADYDDPNFKHMVADIIRLQNVHHVKNLTEAEVQTTLRLLELHALLGNPDITVNGWHPVDIKKNDPRLANLTDTDRFLALLIEYDYREYILCSANCIRLFGGTKYHWRKIGRTCPITTTVSALNECYAGYYGRGWIIAPHICTLIKWIKEHPNTLSVFYDIHLIMNVRKGEPKPSPRVSQT